MDYETTVKLFIADSPTEWVACAMICLYDRDRLSRDDHLGTQVTNSYGEATFRFSRNDFLDLDDRIGGALPELYIEIYDTDGVLVLSTRAQAVRNAVPALIRVPIDREIAERHRLC